MDIKLRTIGSTDKTIRFEVVISNESAGELQTSREVLTKLADKIFEGNYLIQSNGISSQN